MTIGTNCTIGHNVVLHGCTIEDGALIGMGSIVMNGARIGRGSIVGAGAVITEGKQFPEYSMIIGAPARVIRTLGACTGRSDGKRREILRRERTAFQKGSEADRLSFWRVSRRSRKIERNFERIKIADGNNRVQPVYVIGGATETLDGV